MPRNLPSTTSPLLFADGQLDQCQESTSAMTRISSTISAMVILLLPAIWNGFPLLEYDTGGYLARWFEGYLVPSRPAAYGLLLVPAAPFEFWPVLALQGWNRKPLPQGSLPRFPGQAVRFSRPTSR